MEILYLDPSWLVVNKPAGMASVPGGGEIPGSSLYEQLQMVYGKLWIVHRLDKDTTGVILFARNAVTHRGLSLLFEKRAVNKIYHAFLNGLPPWTETTANYSLRAKVGHKRRTAVDQQRGQPAVTHFRILKCFSSYVLVEAIPETGRTHQIRAHAAALGFPIVGDRLYGAPAGQDFSLSRPALHAYSLSFQWEGRTYTFTAPYPQDFARLLEKM
ncbi:MAG: RluA family pseudouridine synthase [Anaerolineales bacterium]|nr:RluA family pseudouridine synthase [Anaerolineales bacterium]MCX7609204.1 RluA family pseudouridine synthase [Anaerolineales bacterium]MDW8227805.1 RluA family pseudouridine synthase [Anaerolineales bacterium]